MSIPLSNQFVDMQQPCLSYRDQFMLLAEEIASDKAEKETRGRAQQQVTVLEIPNTFQTTLLSGHWVV